MLTLIEIDGALYHAQQIMDEDCEKKYILELTWRLTNDTTRNYAKEAGSC